MKNPDVFEEYSVGWVEQAISEIDYLFPVVSSDSRVLKYHLEIMLWIQLCSVA